MWTHEQMKTLRTEKLEKKTLRGYNGCLKMQSFYNEKKGSSSSWKIFCVVCFPQKRNGVEVHHYKKKVSRLNRSWRVEALEKSAEATRRAFKQHHAILHPTEKCCVPHSDFSHLFIPPFQSLLRTCCLLFCCFKCCVVCTNQLKSIFNDTFDWVIYLIIIFWNGIVSSRQKLGVSLP